MTAVRNMTPDQTFTAVQLRNEAELLCSVFFGSPVSTIQGQQGDIALFSSGTLVGYMTVQHRKTRAYLFRTGEENGSEKVAGVYPSVTLLVEARSRGNVRKLFRLVHYLRRKKVPLQELPDMFFCRVHALLASRNMSNQEINALVLKCRTIGDFSL